MLQSIYKTTRKGIIMAKLIMTAEEAQRIALAQLVAKTAARKLPSDRKKGGK